MNQQEQQDKSQYFYRASAADFMKIPEHPIAYWLTSDVYDYFSSNNSIGDSFSIFKGLSTGENEKFIRYWYEVSVDNIFFNCESSQQSKESSCVWYPVNKGGSYRKWFGNYDSVINWYKDGETLRSLQPKSVIRSPKNYFKPCLSWSKVSSGTFNVRYFEHGFVHLDSSNSVIGNGIKSLLAILNYDSFSSLVAELSSTLNFEVGQVSRMPFFKISKVDEKVDSLICMSKADWDSNETSWNFKNEGIVSFGVTKVQDSFSKIIEKEKLVCKRFSVLETEIVQQLETELAMPKKHDINEKEVCLLNNPFSYDIHLYQSEKFKKLISFSLGCMMGRYSIDKPGLILASQGETLQDYLNQIPNPRFMPDSDAILPLTDQEWFADDVTNRVREFVKVVWGEETLQENLAFIAESLCLHAIKPKKGEGALDTIRRYLSTQFYKDHLKTYKKRPIYWLFSSGKEKAFECLVYLHRYNESTLARMRTEYVTPLMGKYDAQHSLLLEQKASASPQQQRELEKDIKALEKKQTELRAFDEQLKHYADMRIKLDLDDGVKVNYGKFGNLLAEVKAVTGDKGD